MLLVARPADLSAVCGHAQFSSVVSYWLKESTEYRLTARNGISLPEKSVARIIDLYDPNMTSADIVEVTL